MIFHLRVNNPQQIDYIHEVSHMTCGCAWFMTSLSHVTHHILWHQMLIQELGFDPKQPFNLNNDNHGAIALTCNPQFHGQSKHIDISHHFLQELIKHGNLKIHHIHSQDNIADVFMKPLMETLFKKFAKLLVKEM